MLYEWSERGEPIDIRVKHLVPPVIEGPEYWTQWDSDVFGPPDFKGEYWEQVSSYNDTGALQIINTPKVEKGNYYRITINGGVQYDYGVLGLKTARASMVGDRHSPDFMYYDILSREKKYIDIRTSHIPNLSLVHLVYQVLRNRQIGVLLVKSQNQYPEN